MSSKPNLANLEFPINLDLVPTPGPFALAGRAQYSYQWIWILSIIFAFSSAWGIGANDVANAFATSVGSRTLRLWQALVIAAFCEFLGAYLLGSRVTDTIKSGITNVNAFAAHPDMLLIGMTIADLTTAIWLFFATKWGLPVSTTHSIVGAIIGMSLASPGGGSAVDWNSVGLIVASWVTSPLLAMVFSGLFYALLRWAILRAENSFGRVWVFFPFVVGLTVFICVLFILIKGGVAAGQGFAAGTKMTVPESVGVSAGVGAGFALITWLFIGPTLRRWITSLSDEDVLRLCNKKPNMVLSDKDEALLKETQEKEKQQQQQRTLPDEFQLEDAPPSASPTPNPNTTTSTTSLTETSSLQSANTVDKPNYWNPKNWPAAVKHYFRDLDDDIHSAETSNSAVEHIHNRAETFPLRTEMAFSYLQVFTAMFASFAHGANDVANAVGPLAATTAIYQTGSATKKVPVPDWILAMGGAGLVLGLAMFGSNIIRVMGKQMTHLSPSRGFCAELMTAFVLVVASFIGMPISSTHTAVGAIIGIGLVEGNFADARYSVNWKLMGRIFVFGWMGTLVYTGLTGFIIMSWTTLSPSQIYPMSADNCVVFYGNATKAAAAASG